MLLNQRLKATNIFRTIFFMPVILGVTIIGLMWTLFLYPLGGPVEKILRLLRHAERASWEDPPFQAFLWVIWVQIWANMGITMIIFLAGLQTIPAELIESSRIDGASGVAGFPAHHLSPAHAQPEHEPDPGNHRVAAGLAAPPGDEGRDERHPGARV